MDAALRHRCLILFIILRLIVSILVLVDAALRLWLGDALPSTALLVSILVLVDAALRPCPVRGNLHHHFVSILVLVDAALRHCSGSNTVTGDIGFNPCFSGCRPATTLWGVCGCEDNYVSILVLVDAALRLGNADTIEALKPRFQSLF